MLPLLTFGQTFPQLTPADSGKVVQGLRVDTARLAARDTLKPKPAPRRAAVSLAGLSSLRYRWVRLDAQGRGKLVDSVSILPSSVSLPDQPGTMVLFDPTTGKLTVGGAAAAPLVDSAAKKPNSQRPDSIRVCYRILPVNLGRTYYRRSRRELDSLVFRDMFFTEDFAPPREEIFRTPGLKKSGNLARGISFGNTQNVFVNSALNLQLEGKLADKLNLTASITDQNVPFQPEGNTQQLQQFDRIFITLENPDKWRITAGDVVLRNKPTNFLRFYKNIQGAALEVSSGIVAKRPGATMMAAGVAKGKFASQQLEPIDNVQGPYRLRGPNGERFIIILAGSEKVYLDGQLLTRGFDFDYIIDYNQAELTFSPKHLITRNSRLRVEFEYSDQNYARSIIHGSHFQQVGKWSANVNLYREADNPNNAPNLDLRPLERDALQAAGDSLNQAVVQGADSAVYARGQIQYLRIDSVQLGEQIYRYSRDSTQQLFNVRFADVGLGNGDYEQSTGAVNGRAYRFVGKRLGRYLPLRVIPAPSLRQVATAGISYQASKNAAVFMEIAASQNDRNLLSTRDDEDNNGTALRVGYTVQDQPLKALGDWKLRSALNYEYTDARFTPIDRYRDIEFDRDWSTTNRLGVVAGGASDNVLNFSVGAVRNELNQMSYRVSRRFRPGDVQGVQHWASVAREVGKLRLRGSLFVLQADRPTTRSRWQRGEAGGEFGGPNARLVPGYAWRFDQNRVLGGTERDSVVSSANYFDEHTAYLRSNSPDGDSARVRYRLDYAFRRTFIPTKGEIQRRDNAQTWQGTLAARLGRTQDVAVLATYRDVQTRTGQGTAADSANQSAVLAKIDHSVSLWQEHVRSETSYSVATGRESKRLFQFQETLPGQGTHYLPPGADPNDLNSYIEAQTADPSQRRYVKVYLASDEYVIAYTNRLTWRLTTTAPRNWRDKGGWRDVAARFSAITFVSLDRRTVDPRLRERLNPFSSQTEDDQVLGLNKVLRSTLFFNRASPRFGAEGSVQQSQQKTLLTGGSDLRSLASQTLTVRRMLASSLVLKLDAARNVRQSRSTALLTRNFRVLSEELGPELAWQPNQTYRLTGTYHYSRKRDTAPQNEVTPSKGTFHETGVEQRLSQAGKRTITTAVRFTKIEFTGQENAPVGFEILNALRPGNNLTWQATVEQRLASGLNLSLTYDGRKPGSIRAVHTGRMQVSVLF